MARSRWWLLIGALCGLMACTQKEDGPSVDGKQFVYSDAVWTVSVYMGGELTVFKDGRYVFQDLGMRVTGSYPAISLRGAEVSLDCTFSSPDAFQGEVSENIGHLDLPSRMAFRKDSRVLDSNGDGLLD